MNQQTSNIEKGTWFDKVPKVELHVHLEGAIPHDALWELVQKYGENHLFRVSNLSNNDSNIVISHTLSKPRYGKTSSCARMKTSLSWQSQ